MILFLMSPAYWVIFYRSTRTIALYFPTPCLFRNSSAHVEDSRSLLFQLRPDIRKRSVWKLGALDPGDSWHLFEGIFVCTGWFQLKDQYLWNWAVFGEGEQSLGKIQKPNENSYLLHTISIKEFRNRRKPSSSLNFNEFHTFFLLSEWCRS